MSNINKKKSIMYLSGEDFYHYCYSIFVILDTLGCREKKFRDYRKLAFLIDIISDYKKVYVVSQALVKNLNPKDHECLLESYANGLTKRSEVLKLMFVLEKRGYVKLYRGNAQEINVTLQYDNLPNGFLNSGLFDFERKNIKEISKKVKRLTSLTLDTMLSKIYEMNGVRAWV